MKPNISVVIPIFNAEPYLEECLDSIVKQSLRNIEIICINDGSTDDSLNILHHYAEYDNRIQIIDKPNSGYGSTVNLGIDKSIGEYISIIEPDDYVMPEMFHTLYETAKTQDLDVVSSNYQWFWKDGQATVYKEYRVFGDCDNYNKIINAEICPGIFEGGFINPAGLFRRDFLNQYHIRHSSTPGAAFQDRGFCFLVLAMAERIVVLEDKFYCYRHDNPHSSIAKATNYRTVLKEYQLLKEQIEERNLRQYLDGYYYKAYSSYRYTFSRCAEDEKLNYLLMLSDELNTWSDSQRLPKTWQEEIEMIKKSPKEFLERFLGLREELRHLLMPYEKVLIYGAGVIGKRIFDELDALNQQKVIGFAVTDTKENDSSYKGMPVRCIEEFVEEKDTLAVVIAVTEKYREEIREKLVNLGFARILLPEGVAANI